MCFAIDIFPNVPLGQIDADALAMPTGAIALERLADRLTISEEGGCACSLLSENAHWDHATWDLRSDVRDALAVTITFVARHLPDGFALQPLWVDDPVTNEVAVTAHDLADRARQNTLQNYTRYIVRSRHASV